MNSDDFRKSMQQVLDLIVEYVHNPKKYSVLTGMQKNYKAYCLDLDRQFGFVYKRFPNRIPFKGTNFESVLDDVRKIILPGTTHWNHPHFHAYYGTGFSYPDILAVSKNENFQFNVDNLGCTYKWNIDCSLRMDWISFFD